MFKFVWLCLNYAAMHKFCACLNPFVFLSTILFSLKYAYMDYVGTISKQGFSGTDKFFWISTTAARSTAVVRMLISLSVYVFVRSLRWMRMTKPSYLLHQENKTNNGRLSWAMPHSKFKMTPKMKTNPKMKTTPKWWKWPQNEDKPKNANVSKIKDDPNNEDYPKFEDEDFLWHKLPFKGLSHTTVTLKTQFFLLNVCFSYCREYVLVTN